MTVAIHQPNFLPHAGYFHKMLYSDTFVFLDHVEFSKGSYTNRVKVEDRWLSLPCVKNTGQKILEVKIFNPDKSYTKLENNLYQNYRKHYHLLMPLLSERLESLVQFNIRSIKLIADDMGIKPNIIRSSDLNIKSSKNEMLIEILQKCYGTTYLTGKADYLEPHKFEDNNIQLEYFNSMENSNGKSIITEI